MRLIKTHDGVYHNPADNPAAANINWNVYGPDAQGRWQVRHGPMILATYDDKAAAERELDALVESVAESVYFMPLYDEPAAETETEDQEPNPHLQEDHNPDGDQKDEPNPFA